MTVQLKQVVQQEDLRLVRDALTQLEQGEHTVTLPSVLTPFLSDLLRHIQQGEALTVVTTAQELTTNEAAALLGVSRPFLIHNLLDAGLLPFHRVGSHRRISAGDLLAYRKEQQRRTALLDELAREAQDLDLY